MLFYTISNSFASDQIKHLHAIDQIIEVDESSKKLRSTFAEWANKLTQLSQELIQIPQSTADDPNDQVIL